VKTLLKQAVKFIGLSGIGWIIDFSTYSGLCLLYNNIVVNNIISSWIGVTFVFIFATRKIFKNNSNISLRIKYIAYLCYQMILIFAISKLLGYVNNYIISNITIEMVVSLSSIISKIVVTPITMIMNFIVMKSIIEKI
jgi:GtrA-like protein.